MPTSYSITEVRANWPAIVRRAEAGQAVTLTRRGQPVAVIVPAREYDELHGARSSFAEAYDRFLKQFPRGRVGLEPGYFESLRGRSPGRKVEL